jgi:hypothetical protein
MKEKENRKRRKEKGNRKIKERKRKGKRSEVYYRHFTFLSWLHSQEKLFCQTFFHNICRFIIESASLAQPQPELSQPQTQLYQTHPKTCLRNFHS